jgi:hypothetical protein
MEFKCSFSLGHGGAALIHYFRLLSAYSLQRLPTALRVSQEGDAAGALASTERGTTQRLCLLTRPPLRVRQLPTVPVRVAVGWETLIKALDSPQLAHRLPTAQST